MSEIKPKVMKKYEYYLCYYGGGLEHDIFLKSDEKPMCDQEQMESMKNQPYLNIHSSKKPVLLEYLLEICHQKKIIVFKKEEYTSDIKDTLKHIYFGSVFNREELISMKKPDCYEYSDDIFKEDIKDVADEMKKPSNRAVLTNCSNIYKLGRYDKVLDKDFNQIWPPLPAKNKQR